MGRYINRTRKAHHGIERRHMTYRLSKSVHRCDLCTLLECETKKDKETLRYTGKRGICPDHHPRCAIKIPFGMVVALVIRFKFHQHRLSSYRAARGRNLAEFSCSYYLGQWYPMAKCIVLYLIIFLDQMCHEAGQSN